MQRYCRFLATLAVFTASLNTCTNSYSQVSSQTPRLAEKTNSVQKPIQRIVPTIKTFSRNEEFVRLSAAGEDFLIPRKRLHPFSMYINGEFQGRALSAYPAAPIMLQDATPLPVRALPTKPSRYVECDYYLLGTGRISYIAVIDTKPGESNPGVRQ